MQARARLPSSDKESAEGAVGQRPARSLHRQLLRRRTLDRTCRFSPWPQFCQTCLSKLSKRRWRPHTGDDGRVTSLTVSREGDVVDEIQATDIIVCAGPWTGAFFKVAIDPTSPLQRLPFVKTASRIGGQRAHSIVVRGTRPVGNHALFVNKISYLAARSATKAGNPELYCRPDGTVYVCGAPDGEELPHTADDVDFSERQVEKLIEQTAVVAPQVFGPDAEIVVRQACFLPMSEATKNPIINFSQQHGLGVAAGHTCWGITLSLGTGKVMAELIFDGRAHSADIRALDGLKVRAE
ncbi:unnamed protein product [Tilletia controversa]|nr:unnamed protein product [Tilletia controversa]